MSPRLWPHAAPLRAAVLDRLRREPLTSLALARRLGLALHSMQAVLRELEVAGLAQHGERQEDGYHWRAVTP